MDIKQLEHLIRSQNLHVLQDTRVKAGDAMVFHAWDHKGHTTDLSKAHLFTLKEANLQKAERPIPLPGAARPRSDEILP